MHVEGACLPVGFEYQELELLDSDTQVLAAMEDGTPAVVMHSFGKGKTLYFNNFEGLVLMDNLWPQILNLVWQVIGSSMELSVEKSNQVHLSFIENDAQKAMLAVNFADEPQTICVKGLPAGCKLTEIFSGSTVTVTEQTVLQLPADSHAVYVWAQS